MLEENQNTDQTQGNVGLDYLQKRAMQKERNVASNAKAVQNAAEFASKSANPYAKAIGTAVKVADKISGGKASEKLGKVMNTANKITPGGRTAQRITNKVAESRTADRIAGALNKKKQNSTLNSSANARVKGDTNAKQKGNDFFSKKEVEEQASDGGGVNFEVSAKALKTLAFASVPIFVIIIFICLFISASQTYINAIGLGHADSISSSDAEGKINDMKDEDKDREITDENANEAAFVNDQSSLEFMYSKLDKVNLITVSNRDSLLRKYNEADIAEIESFYSGALVQEGNIVDVYAFFFKMYDLYVNYRDKYNVFLDLPLLMSTLKIEDSDMNIVFESNTKNYDRYTKPQEEYDYYYNWNDHGYKISKNDSSHDMELLAQHMVSIVDSCEEPAEDGKCYVIDDNKYREFLKEFIEKKYYLNGEHTISTYENNSTTPPIENTPTQDEDQPKNNSLADAMINLANSEYENGQGYNNGEKYQDAFGYERGAPWCAMFVWYLTANTNFNGQKLYPNIITEKTAGVKNYIDYFYNNENSNIKFYYNNSCSNLKDKNNSKDPYIPKKGDFIFFRWDKKYYDVSDWPSHVGIVEKYEDGFIYTIEGNSSHKIQKLKYKLNQCDVIGFGSWY